MKSWQRLAWLAVIARDHGACLRCGRAGSEVHHILSRSLCPQEDLWTLQNMVSLCKNCHSSMAHTKAGRAAMLSLMVRNRPQYAAWYDAREHFRSRRGWI